MEWWNMASSFMYEVITDVAVVATRINICWEQGCVMASETTF
jgi:hypothetical protein